MVTQQMNASREALSRLSQLDMRELREEWCRLYKADGQSRKSPRPRLRTVASAQTALPRKSGSQPTLHWSEAGFEPSVPRDTTNLSMSTLVGSPPPKNRSERNRHRNRRALPRGTDGSNPVPSSAESGANLIFAGESHRRLRSPTDVGFPGPHLALQHFDRIGQVAALQRRVLKHGHDLPS
jgi:hypothetical protein